MVVKGDQQRIRALIKDTLTLLCKNGLSFDTQFSMEALIVFTLDDEEVFHVSINETVKNQLAKAQSIAENESNDDSFVEDSSPHFPSDRDSSQHKTGSSDTNRRQNRKRTLSGVKQELSEQGAGDENGGQWPADDSWNQKSPPDPDLSPATYDESSFQSQGSSTEPPNAKRRNVHSSSNNDIIIIKEEMDDSASEQNVCYNTQAPYGDIDLAQALGSDSLGAGPSQSSAQNMWADPSQHQNMSRTSTITSEGGDMSQMSQSKPYGIMGPSLAERPLGLTSVNPWAAACERPGEQSGERSGEQSGERSGEQPGVPRQLQCPLCSKMFSRRNNLLKHQRRHLGIYRYTCSSCGKGFFSRSEWELHEAKHKVDIYFQCTFCPCKYGHRRGLLRHIRVKHPGFEMPAQMVLGEESGEESDKEPGEEPGTDLSGELTMGKGGDPYSEVGGERGNALAGRAGTYEGREPSGEVGGHRDDRQDAGARQFGVGELDDSRDRDDETDGETEQSQSAPGALQPQLEPQLSSQQQWRENYAGEQVEQETTPVPAVSDCALPDTKSECSTSSKN